MTKSEMLYRSLFGFALADTYGIPFELEPAKLILKKAIYGFILTCHYQSNFGLSKFTMVIRITSL